MDECILRSCGVLKRYLACDDDLSDSSVLSAIAEANLFSLDVSCMLLESIARNKNSELSLAELDTLYETMCEYEMSGCLEYMFEPGGLALTLAKKFKNRHIDIIEFVLLVAESGQWETGHAHLMGNELRSKTLLVSPLTRFVERL